MAWQSVCAVGASMNRDEEAMWDEVFETLDNQLANDHSLASHPPTEDRPFVIAPFSDQRPPAGDPTVGAHRQDITQLEAHQLQTPLQSQSSPTRISRPRTQGQSARTQPYRLDVRHGSTMPPGAPSASRSAELPDGRHYPSQLRGGPPHQAQLAAGDSLLAGVRLSAGYPAARIQPPAGDPLADSQLPEGHLPTSGNSAIRHFPAVPSVISNREVCTPRMPQPGGEYTVQHSPSELANQASLLAVRAERAMLTADRELQEIEETIRKMVNLRSQKLAAAREARESWKRAARTSFHYMAAAAAVAAGMPVARRGTFDGPTKKNA